MSPISLSVPHVCPLVVSPLSQEPSLVSNAATHLLTQLLASAGWAEQELLHSGLKWLGAVLILSY